VLGICAALVAAAISCMAEDTESGEDSLVTRTIDSQHTSRRAADLTAARRLVRRGTALTHIDLSNRTDFPAAFDERTTLTQFLQYVRLTVHAKCVDLSQSDAAKTPLPGSPVMSVTGLVSHLRWVEAFWIDVIFLGQPNQWPGTDDDSELQMRHGLERPLADLLDEYAAQAARTDEVVASRAWDTESIRKDGDTGKPIALRYIIMYLIEETARHNGHLDIVRELADGVTGD
jgi:uncharacterized damage-inducible protein DinB